MLYYITYSVYNRKNSIIQKHNNVTHGKSYKPNKKRPLPVLSYRARRNLVPLLQFPKQLFGSGKRAIRQQERMSKLRVETGGGCETLDQLKGNTLNCCSGIGDSGSCGSHGKRSS